MNPILSFDQAAGMLPFGLRQLALSMTQAEKAVAEEIRLRAGKPIALTMPEGETILPFCPNVTPGDLRTTLEIATQASAHTALERVRNGFVTVRGGHRVGLCGTAVVKDGAICNMRELSSMNIRIAREVQGIGAEIVKKLYSEKEIPSVLVLAPPGAGKTTLLRDLIRLISSGECGAALRVGTADERGELGAMYHGIPQFDLGPNTDVMDGCSKAAGLMILLRGMNPQVLAVDEITAPDDVDALEMAAGCGTTLLATAHGRELKDLQHRPIYRRLLEQSIFQKVVLIEQENGVRQYRIEDIRC